MIVAKFGGSSLADAGQFKKVISLVRSDPTRQYIVVSAPGKRSRGDKKITDLLYGWHRAYTHGCAVHATRGIIGIRYSAIIDGLGITFDLAGELAEIETIMKEGATEDYIASRGEYLNGKILAIALGYDFVDPANCIGVNEDGRFDNSYEKLHSALLGKRAVIPGFYGALAKGPVKTFSRGGSDITGAIVARAVGAIYENWTDVSGLLMADPRVVQNPRTIPTITYEELRELTYMGASVFHQEAMFPVQEARITTIIRNTNNPGGSNTFIVPDDEQLAGTANSITGIAGRKNFTVITVTKRLMNQQVGFARRILTILETNDISFEHMPGGIDTLSIIIDSAQLDGKLEKVVQEINDECSPDKIETSSDMAMIAIVGRGMIHHIGVAAQILRAIADGGVSLRMINQGASEMSIIVGVENADYEKAVQVIYKAFVK